MNMQVTPGINRSTLILAILGDAMIWRSRHEHKSREDVLTEYWLDREVMLTKLAELYSDRPQPFTLEVVHWDDHVGTPPGMEPRYVILDANEDWIGGAQQVRLDSVINLSESE